LHYDDGNLSKGYVRFMAVAVDCQSRGIGSKILEQIEKIAGEHKTERMKLKSRENAIGFYEKNGYVLGSKCTESFFKTPHWNMTKELLSSL